MKLSVAVVAEPDDGGDDEADRYNFAKDGDEGLDFPK
jgi:hypothetical protein